MTLSPNQQLVGSELGATVTMVRDTLAQVQKVQDDLRKLGSTSIANDVAAAIQPLQDTLSVLTKDLSVVNDLAGVNG